MKHIKVCVETKRVMEFDEEVVKDLLQVLKYRWYGDKITDKNKLMNCGMCQIEDNFRTFIFGTDEEFEKWCKEQQPKQKRL